MKYTELKRKHQEEFNAFPIGAAFSEKQLREELKRLGLDPDTGRNEVVSIGGGAFIRERDQDAFIQMLKRHADEMEAEKEADTTGKGFLLEMFKYELANHEYSYTGDTEDTLYALGITPDDLEKNENMRTALSLACYQAMFDE